MWLLWIVEGYWCRRIMIHEVLGARKLTSIKRMERMQASYFLVLEVGFLCKRPSCLFLMIVYLTVARLRMLMVSLDDRTTNSAPQERRQFSRVDSDFRPNKISLKKLLSIMSTLMLQRKEVESAAPRK